MRMASDTTFLREAMKFLDDVRINGVFPWIKDFRFHTVRLRQEQ